MIDMNEMPNDVDSLAQRVLERDATLEAMSLALHEIQLRFDQLALLIEKSRQMQTPAAARTRAATFTHVRSMRLSNLPNFAESNCSCPQCTGKS
jgi:hypothetical protein